MSIHLQKPVAASPTGPSRSLHPELRRLRPLLFVAALLSISLPCSAQTQGENALEPHKHILTAVQQYLDKHYGQTDGARFRVDRIDPRLRLHRCDEALTVRSNSNNSPRGGRLTVQVQCYGSSPWHIFVPVRIEHMVRVINLTRPLAAGSRIQSDDLGWTEVDANRVNRDYLTDPKQIIGHVVERPVQTGHILSIQDLGIAQIIKRGDHVAMRAGSGGFSVTMEGIALGSAGLGQRVNVKNSRTGTVVQGTVVDRNTIQVIE